MTAHPTRANHVQARRRARGGVASSAHRGWRAWHGWRAAPALGLIVVLVALAVRGGSSAAAGNNTLESRAPASGAVRVAAGVPLRIERADLHVDGVSGESEFEMNLAITQTQNDCDKPPQGQLCLRYTISADEITSEDGYGLIPISAVRISPSTITLSIDTSHDPQMHFVAGQGGQIALTWFMPLGLPHPVNQTAALAAATVQGSILGYTVPSANVTAAVLMSSAP